MIKYWREITIAILVLLVFILGLGLAFITGRGYESRYVQQLAIERQQLLQQTNRLLNQIDWNAQSRQSWESLGYTFPDSTR